MRGIDFGIITAINYETNALLKRLESVKRVRGKPPDIRDYYRGHLSLLDKSVYEIVVVQCTRAGNSDAVQAAKDLITRWNPAFLIMLGIAGGYPRGGLKIGDVVIATEIVEYDYKRFFQEDWQPRPRHHQISALLLAKFASVPPWQGEDITLPSEYEKEEWKPKVHKPGPIAAGNALFADAKARNRLLEFQQDLLAVEMESEGVAIAAWQRNPPIPVFVVRGICDLADLDTKGDNGEGTKEKRQEFAADSAASFLIHFLRDMPISMSTSTQIERVKNTGKIQRQRTEQNVQIDWGEAPIDETFYGREDELLRLSKWLASNQDNCRIVALLGMAGIGKTSLVVQLVKRLISDVDYIIWRSLKNDPPLEEILKDFIDFISNHEVTKFPNDTNGQLSLLKKYLKKSRCLLILDNFETILKAGKDTGHYNSGYEDYGSLIEMIGKVHHESCLILTSREKSKDIALLEGENSLIRSFSLSGLDEASCQKMLKNKHLTGTKSNWKTLSECYGRNPLALKLVSEHIREVFNGEIEYFLNEGKVIFRDIRLLLNQYFNRLSPQEQQIMYWLAIEREPVSPRTLKEEIIYSLSDNELFESIGALRRRYLVEGIQNKFTLQNVVMEYVTDSLVKNIHDEILSEEIYLLNTHAIVKAQNKEYIRNSQKRIILRPIVESLVKVFSKKEINMKISKILSNIRQKAPNKPGYAANNAINILSEIDIDLRGWNFSNLAIWQAYLQEMELHEINFYSSDFKDTIFKDTFGSITAVAFNNGGNLIATGAFNGQVRIWQSSNLKQLLNFEGHSDWISAVCFSPDDNILASSSSDQTIRLWRVSTGECVKIIRGHANRIRSIDFSPDGVTLVSASEDKTIRIWNIKNGECIKILKGHTNRVKAIAFSPDGTIIASGSDDQTIRLWDINTYQCLKILKGHSNWIRSIAFSPDGKRLISGGDDGTIRLWDLDKGICIKVMQGNTSKIWVVAFNNDGNLIGSGGNDSTVRIWNINKGKCINVLKGHSSWVRSIAFSPNDKLIVSGSEDQTIRLWDLKSGQGLITLKGYTNRVFGVAFRPDNITLAGGLGNHKAYLWNINDGECYKSLKGHNDQVWTVAFSPDGTKIASGSDDRTVKLWDLKTGICLLTLEGHEGWIGAVAFHPKKDIVASGSDDHTIRLWDITNGICVKMLHGHIGRVSSLAFSPDGLFMVSGSEDGTVKLWRVDSGECITTLQGHTSLVFAVAFSPDGKIVASGSDDRTIKIWDISSYECIKTLIGHSKQVWSVAFSPNGTTLASGSDDRTIKIWDISSYECIKTLIGHSRQVWSVAFSFDGATLASGSEDETIRLWNIKNGECIKILKCDKPYERMNIKGTSGLTNAQRKTLKDLGAMY